MAVNPFNAPIKLAITAYQAADGGTDVERLAADVKAIADRLDPRVRPLVQFVATNEHTSDQELSYAIGIAVARASVDALEDAPPAKPHWLDGLVGDIRLMTERFKFGLVT